MAYNGSTGSATCVRLRGERYLVLRLSEAHAGYRWCWTVLRATSGFELNQQFCEIVGSLSEHHTATERLMSMGPPGALGGRKRTVLNPDKSGRVWFTLGDGAAQARDFLSKGGFHVVTVPMRGEHRRMAKPLSAFSRALLMDRITDVVGDSTVTLAELQHTATVRGRPRKEATVNRRELERVIASLRCPPRAVPVHRLAEIFGCSISTISTLANRGAKSEAVSTKKGNARCDIALGLTPRVDSSVYRMPTRINPSDSSFKASDDAAAA